MGVIGLEHPKTWQSPLGDLRFWEIFGGHVPKENYRMRTIKANSGV